MSIPSPGFARKVAQALEQRVRLPEYVESLGRWRSRFMSDCAKPELRFVAWLITRRCNLRCGYCVLPRETSSGPELTTAQAMAVFDQIAYDFDARRIRVGISGGEPTMRSDLVAIVAHITSLGFQGVSVDSNGIQYGGDLDLIDRLVDAGMTRPTISVDGTGEGQRRSRGDCAEGADAWRAIEYVQTRYPNLGLTTICAASPNNLSEVPGVFQRFSDLGITFARVSPILALGRAASNPSMLLPEADLANLLLWVAEQRWLFAQGKSPLEISLIDDGWCGYAWEGGMLRTDFMYCRAGVTTMGLGHDGAIMGCPVMSTKFNQVGSAIDDRVSRVWEEGFARFRDRSWLKQGECAGCSEWDGCQGGSLHNRGDGGELRKCPARMLAHAMMARDGSSG